MQIVQFADIAKVRK